MGQCKSKTTQRSRVRIGGEQSEKEANKQLDHLLKLQKQEKCPIKMILLGAGESGKSTVFKQMQIIHNNGFTTNQKKAYANVIRRQLVENLNCIVVRGNSLGVLPCEFSQRAAELLKLESKPINAERLKQIEGLWKSEELQQVFSQRHLIQLCEFGEFFLSHADRMLQADYIPTYEDILKCRTRTTGVSQLDFSVFGVDFRVVDVAGQRNERRKWIHCFDDVEVVIFVAAISEYDQVLVEDESTNRLHESIKLFGEVCNSEYFSKAAIVLFLNKRDLFNEKIAVVDLNLCFPEYTGGCNEEAASSFIQQQFFSKRTRRTQDMFVHVTTATDTGNMRFVFECVQESIVLHNMGVSGIL